MSTQSKTRSTQERAWQYVRKSDEVAFLLREKVKNATFFLKDTEPPAEVYRGSVNGNDQFEFHYSPDLYIGDKMTLYATLNRQLEVDFDVLEHPEEGSVIARPTLARISKVQRQEKRIIVQNNEVMAAHFQVSKSELAVDNTRPQVANKVIYTEFERSLAKEIPGLQIFDYANRERPEETHFLDRETRSIFVEDLTSPASYESKEPGILNLREYLEEEELWEKKQKEYLNEQSQSILVVPILYEMTTGKRKPIAFFYVKTPRGQSLSIDLLHRLQTVSDEIIRRIMDANMLNISDRQRVVDICSRGVLLELTHPDLVKYVPNSRVMTFDLIFKMQAPLRFRGIVRHLKKTQDSLLAGISLEGTGHHDGAGKKSALDRLANLIKLLS